MSFFEFIDNIFKMIGWLIIIGIIYLLIGVVKLLLPLLEKIGPYIKPA